MEKAPDAYRTISEVAEDLDLPQHVLRFWETRFGQIRPLKRGGGRRYYRPDDVDLLKGIRHLLYKEGYTIKGVQRILKEHGAKAVQAVARGPAPADWVPDERGPEERERDERIAGQQVITPASAAPVEPISGTGYLAGVDEPFGLVDPAGVQSGDMIWRDQGAAEGHALPDEPIAAMNGDGSARPDFAGSNSAGPNSRDVGSGEPATEADRPVTVPSPAQAALSQVAMFRGALQRGETGMGAGSSLASPLEFAGRAQARAEALAQPAREQRATLHLVAVLEDLVAARAAIDRLILRKAG